MELGKALRAIRTFHNISLGQLAVSLDVSKSYLSEVESGKKTATISVAEKYADHFDLPLSSIIELAEKLGNKNKLPKHKQLIAKLIEWVSED
ncbi:helix-turn-helix domain-containing protein [Vibrio mimicus]|uniref:XRE family transcriptional regulator n=1 Tax=Vibrio mimicus TaxID=674 RepID=A0A2J9VJJ3_VIBMI|nr:helix-turn-helix transcriptional regulator [Vibrio mimicus]KFE29480.1 helix-turn-helix family protein [Vibrio mimicus]PNM63842.1 XRE family transcriptional regulator [Vibrio mimicus]